MELLKDYDRTILYHPGKANVVPDALSRKSIGSLVHIIPARRPLVKEIHKLESEGVHFELRSLELLLAHEVASKLRPCNIRIRGYSS